MAFYTKVAASNRDDIRIGDSVSDVSSKIFLVMKKKHEEDTKYHELTKNFESEKLQKEEDHHTKLIHELNQLGKRIDEEIPWDYNKEKPRFPNNDFRDNERPMFEEPSAVKEVVSVGKSVVSTAVKTVGKVASTAVRVAKAAVRAVPALATAALVGVGMIGKSKLAMPSESVADAIGEASETTGTDKALLYAVANQESRFKENATPGGKGQTASGLFQFTNSTSSKQINS